VCLRRHHGGTYRCWPRKVWLVGWDAAFSPQAVLPNVTLWLTTMAVTVEGSGRDTDLPRPPGTEFIVKRHRCLMTAMVAISVAALAACGGGSTSSQPPPVGTSTSSATSPAPTSTTAAAAAGEVRLGCGTYCQSAGGFGGAGGQGQEVDALRVVGGAVILDADGYVPVELTCLISATCKGVIVLSIVGYSAPTGCGVDEGGYPRGCGCGRGGMWDGCSDMVVNANSTQTIGVPLTAGALAYARAHSPVTVSVTAPVDAQCEDIPQLAPTCAQINLKTLIHGELQVSAT
jgi:hypothetical protein